MYRYIAAIYKLIIFLMVVSVCGGCVKETQSPSSVNNRAVSSLEPVRSSHNYYDISVFEVPAITENISRQNCPTIGNILRSDDRYFICSYFLDQENTIEKTNIYCVDHTGTQLYSFQLDGCQVPDCIIDGQLTYLTTEKTVVMIDNMTGEVTKTLVIDFPEVTSIAECADGFVAAGSGRIIRFDPEGNELGRVENEAFSFFDHSYPYFEDNGIPYAVIDTGNRLEYWRLDFENGASELITDTVSSNIALGFCYGKYVIDGTGEYRLCLNDLQIAQIADWNENDIMPERKTILTPSQFFPFDDSHLAKTYVYGDGSCDVLLFSLAGQSDTSDKEILTIGGYGAASDLSIRMAVYHFNTSNEDYRIQIIDYSDDFPFATGLEAQEAVTALYSYFNSGNAPDIFFGNYFDYISMGGSGMVQDLVPYIENDETFDTSELSQSVGSIMFPRGNPCYQIFSSYAICGAWGLDSVFEDPDVSMSELESYSQDTTLWGAVCSTDIADQAIRYPIMRSMERTALFSEEDLEEIIRFSIDHGIPTQSQDQVDFNRMDTVSNGEYLLSRRIVSDVFSYYRYIRDTGESFRYIGYPSSFGSTHPVMPNGMVAMSSGTEHPDKCWEFMRYLLDEDVQMMVASNQSIPVNQTVLDQVLEYAGRPYNPDDCPDGLRALFLVNDPVPENVIREYREAVDSVDTVIMYDWGLYNIICEEVDSYDLQEKPIDQIAESLFNRLELYVEDYQS